MLLLGFGDTCYKPKVARDGSLLLVEAGKVPASARLPLRLKVYNASVAIAPLQPVFTHVLRIPSSDKPDGPNVFCLLFDRFAKKPTGAYLLFLEEGLKDPLRADLSVRIRTECPPIDVQDGIIAAVIGSSIWIGWAKNGALLRLNVPTMEHEVPEAIALDWRGETLICALRSRHGKGDQGPSDGSPAVVERHTAAGSSGDRVRGGRDGAVFARKRSGPRFQERCHALAHCPIWGLDGRASKRPSRRGFL